MENGSLVEGGTVGAGVGYIDGSNVGARLGCVDGSSAGNQVGCCVGSGVVGTRVVMPAGAWVDRIKSLAR